MSWQQWPTANQPPVPSVLNSSQPINSAPAVVPPGMQYTPEQWAQLQQQNWNQWAQWQQQYQQWHQQYGAEYQKSINALAQAAQAQQLPNVAVPPPLPVEPKPPLPTEEPPPNVPALPAFTTAPPRVAQNYNTAHLAKASEQRPPVHYPKNNQNWQRDFRYGQENKRPFEGGDDTKRPMNKPDWPSQPPPRKENPEELSEAEKKFDKQFAEWEAQFNKWKEQNVEHPDKEQYREYEKKWESWRAQLLERREQMKRKRLGLSVESPNRPKQSPGGFHNFNSQQNFNQAQFNQKGAKLGGPPLLPGGTFPKPPPTMNDEPLKFKDQKVVPELDDVGDFFKPNTGGGIPGLDLVKDEPKSAQKEDDVVFVDEKPKENKGPDFDAISKGINTILGDQKLLNMLSLVSQTQNPKQNDNLTNTVSRIKDGSNLESNSQPAFPEHSSQSYEEHSNHSETYGQREFVNNFDDQTRSSFTMAQNEEPRFEGPGNFNRNPNQFGNRFGNFNKGSRFDDQFNRDRFGPSEEPAFRQNQGRFGQNQERFGPSPRFGTNQAHFDSNQERFGGNQENFGSNQERFGPNRDNFGPNPERFSLNQEHFDPNQKRFGPNQDNFGADQGRFDRFGNQERFGPGQDRFGPNQNKSRFGPIQNRFDPNQDKRFGPNQDEFSANQEGFGPNQEEFGSNQEGFGPNQDRFDPNQERFPNQNQRFGPNQDKRFGPNQDRFNVPPDDRFGNGRNLGPKGQFGFDGDNYNQNRFNDYKHGFEENCDDYDYDAVAASFENEEPHGPPRNLEESWKKEIPFKDPEAPMETETPLEKPDDIFQPTTVIDYDHKTLKNTEPEVLIEPIFMFDYRHKPLSRIPLPQRPKWLAETVKNIREFDPPVVRPYEPPNLRRYPSSENWRNDRYQENRSHNRRYEERQSFDDRRSYNDRPYEDGRKWEEKKSFNDDRNYQDRRNAPRMDLEEEKISDTEWPEDEEMETRNQTFSKFQKPEPVSKNAVLIEDLISPPGRFKRPPRLVIILRGPPGSGKTFLAKLIKDKEVENGGSAPRILSLDDYFMVEQEKEVTEDGKKVKVKEMIYEYEAEMEESYRSSLIKSFKKTITDGYFSFIIVDNVNDKVKYFGEMWSFAKQNGFQVYICQLDLDAQTCSKRNIHGRSEADIEKCVSNWEPTPSHHPILDATSILQSASIPEVEMEEVNSPESDVRELDGSEDQVARSKWDNFDCSVDNLAKLDGVSKPLRHRTMEEYLQLDTDWTPVKPTKPGQKRVRWADLEEQKQQEKMRAIGFVVGHTNWDRMMDPTGGSSALTQTKYIERTGRYKVDQK